MPIYEYECSACNARVERWLKVADRDNPGPHDEVCGGILRRVITCPNVHFDGADPDWPTAARRWESDRQRTIEREQRTLKEHGEYYANPRHW